MKRIMGARILGLLLAAAAVGGAGGNPPATEQLPAAGNMASYFVQFRCADGGNILSEPGCAASPQLGDTPAFWRRADWGSNGVPYYEFGDAVLADNKESLIQIFDFGPAYGANVGTFVESYGDGGQVAFTNGTISRFTETQDGGTPGIQYFVGPACGGQGWLLWNAALGMPTGWWVSTIARLSDNRSSSACPPLGSAYTRWTVQTVSYPFIIGVQQTVGVPTIISEHYSKSTIAASPAMERFYFGENWGLLKWEAWTTSTPVSKDLAQRCPPTSFEPTPSPGGPWQLSDCRLWTQIIPEPGNWSVDDFGWP